MIQYKVNYQLASVKRKSLIIPSQLLIPAVIFVAYFEPELALIWVRNKKFNTFKRQKIHPAYKSRWWISVVVIRMSLLEVKQSDSTGPGKGGAEVITFPFQQ